MYGQKKDEDVFLKYLREKHLGEMGIYTGSGDNSSGLEERRRRQQREREAAQAERARIAEWDRQQAAQRAEKRAWQDAQDARAPEKKDKMGWSDYVAIVGLTVVIYWVLGLAGLVLKFLGLG